MKSVAFALPLSLSLVACYGAAPPKPPVIPLPPLQEGAEIDVHSETKTTIEDVQKTASTCPAGHAEGDPACTVTHYTVAEPVTRTHTTAAYAAEPIDYAQFQVLTDLKREHKLAELDDLSHRCQRANIPRYAGLGMMLGGLVGGIVAGAAGSKSGEGALIYGGLGLGAVAYGVGYFAYGGRQCVEAQQLYDHLDVSRSVGQTTVEGGEYASEMKQLAEEFNAARGGRRTALQMRPRRKR